MSQAAESEDGRLWRSSSRYYWRRLHLGDNFKLEDVIKMESKLRQYENRHGESDPAVMFVNSCGGSVIAMLRVCDALQHTTVPVIAKIIGNCYGAAFCVVQSCTERVAVSGSKIGLVNNSIKLELTLHADADSGLIFQLADEEIRSLSTSREKILDVLQERLHMHSREDLLRAMKEERIVGAEEALKLGYIDDIVPD